jgi:hypothetical protein
MLRLYRYERRKFKQYTPSAQTHCHPDSVEEWILQDADASGQITNVSVELHGTSIAVAHACEARVLAALYAADHNDYVTMNLSYPMEVSPNAETAMHGDDDEQSDSMSDTEHSMQQAKLDDDYEQNEMCVVNNFGPAHAKDTDW